LVILAKARIQSLFEENPAKHEDVIYHREERDVETTGVSTYCFEDSPEAPIHLTLSRVEG